MIACTILQTLPWPDKNSDEQQSRINEKEIQSSKYDNIYQTSIITLTYNYSAI